MTWLFTGSLSSLYQGTADAADPQAVKLFPFNIVCFPSVLNLVIELSIQLAWLGLCEFP